MGDIWLRDLPDVLSDAKLAVVTYSGWENRSRSSGGYDALLGIGIHHDASNSNSSDQSAWDWAWKNSSDKPIGCIRLGRTGEICVGAAGATNTMGKGGPLTTSKGTIPLDKGNQNMIAIEAGNNGVGETWGSTMIDAYMRMLAALCQAYGFDPNRDIFTHNSYCQPSCPGRKIDPAGPTPSEPTLGGTSGTKIWSHDDVRACVSKIMVKPPQPEPAPPTPKPTQEANMLFIARRSSTGVIMVGDGISARRIQDNYVSSLERALTDGIGPAYHDPSTPNRPEVRSLAKIPTLTDAPLSVWLGREIDESTP